MPEFGVSFEVGPEGPARVGEGCTGPEDVGVEGDVRAVVGDAPDPVALASPPAGGRPPVESQEVQPARGRPLVESQARVGEGGTGPEDAGVEGVVPAVVGDALLDPVALVLQPAGGRPPVERQEVQSARGRPLVERQARVGEGGTGPEDAGVEGEAPALVDFAAQPVMGSMERQPSVAEGQAPPVVMGQAPVIGGGPVHVDMNTGATGATVLAAGQPVDAGSGAGGRPPADREAPPDQAQQPAGDVRSDKAAGGLDVALRATQAGIKVYHHGPQQNFTPECVKNLVPGRCKIPGVYIVWRRTTKVWEAKYAGAMPCQSFSKRWQGPKENLTEMQALLRCLDWMWTEHAKRRCASQAHVPTESTKPNQSEVERAMVELHLEYDRRVARVASASVSASASTPPVVAAAPSPGSASTLPAVAAAFFQLIWSGSGRSDLTLHRKLPPRQPAQEQQHRPALAPVQHSRSFLLAPRDPVAGPGVPLVSRPNQGRFALHRWSAP